MHYTAWDWCRVGTCKILRTVVVCLSVVCGTFMHHINIVFATKLFSWVSVSSYLHSLAISYVSIPFWYSNYSLLFIISDWSGLIFAVLTEIAIHLYNVHSFP